MMNIQGCGALERNKLLLIGSNVQVELHVC